MNGYANGYASGGGGDGGGGGGYQPYRPLPPRSSHSNNAPGYPTRKRLIYCCDGTWMSSTSGAKDKLQVPSNVTRISRCFKRRCTDGTLQIIAYESGVGTSTTGVNVLDKVSAVAGGTFGLGVSEVRESTTTPSSYPRRTKPRLTPCKRQRISEACSFLCANYSDGDEIILVGFSRGAFTARSVAGMVANLGLLTREGLKHLWPIFRDMQHWGDDDYDDPFPDVPFPRKPRTEEPYRERLERDGLTRVRQRNGELISIKAVCVWDTVGSLGIPRVAWLDTFGLKPPFYDE